MMPFSDYSTNPASNNTLAGLSLAEGGTSPASINNMLRQLMADGKTLADLVAALDMSGYATLAGPAFTAQPTYSGRGALVHHNNPANASGRIFIQAAGAAAPAMQNGDILLTY